MMHTILSLLLALVASGAVVRHCIKTSGAMSRRDWLGHPFQFAGFAAGIAMTGSGALGVALDVHEASGLLLGGVACWMVFDRRSGGCR